MHSACEIIITFRFDKSPGCQVAFRFEFHNISFWRLHISVIGYGYEVKELCSGFLEDLYSNPIRIEKKTQKISDGNGGLVEASVNQPIWVEPINEDRWTNMRDGFKMAKQLVEDWISDKPECPAPVIINISDGMPYYDYQEPSVCIRETTDVAKQIMNISNSDGNVLIFNAEIGDGGHKIITPSTEADVEVAGQPAQFLYEKRPAYKQQVSPVLHS